MKLTTFLFGALSWWKELELPDELEKEELPFDISEEAYEEYLKNYDDENIEARKLFKDYCEENNLSLKSWEIIDYDLEKGYEVVEVVFSFKDKYYRYSFDRGPFGSYCELLEAIYPEELEEVIPYKEIITVTKWKSKEYEY